MTLGRARGYVDWNYEAKQSEKVSILKAIMPIICTYRSEDSRFSSSLARLFIQFPLEDQKSVSDVSPAAKYPTSWKRFGTSQMVPDCIVGTWSWRADLLTHIVWERLGCWRRLWRCVVCVWFLAKFALSLTCYVFFWSVYEGGGRFIVVAVVDTI